MPSAKPAVIIDATTSVSPLAGAALAASAPAPPADHDVERQTMTIHANERLLTIRSSVIDSRHAFRRQIVASCAVSMASLVSR